MAAQTVITNYPADDDIAVKPKSSWKSYLWDTFDLPKEERWLLFKLDACVLTFSSVSRQYNKHADEQQLTKLDWLLSQVSRLEQCYKRVSQWYGGGSKNVWKPASHQYHGIHCWLRDRSSPIQPAVDPSFTPLGHSFCKSIECRSGHS